MILLIHFILAALILLSLYLFLSLLTPSMLYIKYLTSTGLPGLKLFVVGDQISQHSYS